MMLSTDFCGSCQTRGPVSDTWARQGKRGPLSRRRSGPTGHCRDRGAYSRRQQHALLRRPLVPPARVVVRARMRNEAKGMADETRPQSAELLVDHLQDRWVAGASVPC